MDETTQTGSTPESKRMSKDPNPLSTEYHKAQKQLMLWAAILFVWELVGIDLQKAKEAGGYASALINSIKSPQAVPWVLFILVPYFGFKLRTEWRQCNERRREVPEAKQDYYSACAFAAIAIALYIWQTLSHVQIADRIDSWKLSGITAALLVILCFLSGCAKLIALPPPGGLGLWRTRSSLIPKFFRFTFPPLPVQASPNFIFET